jgi:hypothetical protein
MDRLPTNFVGLFLILGAALGFAFGLVIAGADPAWAAVYGAAGAGLGIVLGAIVASMRNDAPRRW